ncbi:LPS translocon maturation chaperone LptM [Roseateles toxinivorans]|uniref:LPS translocon maturation chaperone LptM n=1 Tax=Roseateles toxinivorans TaxID=270368 RepID=UPI00105F7526|nr:lipoprotein [Roseateles toxinivorans]
MSKQQQSVVARRIASPAKGWCASALLMLALCSAGCGQKGPLYLPAAAKAPTPAASAAKP